MISEDISLRRSVEFLDGYVVGTLLDITTVRVRELDDKARPLIARFGILRVEVDEYTRKRENLEAYEDIRESLYECDLSWCLEEYGPAKVDNGVLKESVPTQSIFLNKTDTFNLSESRCRHDDFAESELIYKRFRLEDDADQYRRLADAFRGCPNIAAMSEDENIYIVNTMEELGIW
jgi:hypothetical protein